MAEFDDFVKDYTRNQAGSYFKKFWANTAMNAGLTVKYDGKEFIVKPENISVTDLGAMCGKCLCGHPIRYEYWFDNLGPIGSSCIQVMTGLDGQDLRMIVRGSKMALKDKDELQEIKRQYGTLEEQRKQDALLDMVLNLMHENDEVPEIIQKFWENNIPMPQPVKAIVWDYKNKINYLLKVKAKYGQEVATAVQEAGHYVPLFTMEKLQGHPKFIDSILDMSTKIQNGSATEKTAQHFVKLVNRMKNPRFIDAYLVLEKLIELNGKIPEFWRGIILDMQSKAYEYGMTDAQIGFVLEKSTQGKPGLAVRFAKILNEITEPTN